MKALLTLTVAITMLPLLVLANQPSGLIMYYPLDGDGINAAGPNLNLTAHNGATYTTGLFGQAASLDGVDDWFGTTDTVPIVGNESRTISVWVRPETITGYANIVAWGGLGGPALSLSSLVLGRQQGSEIWFTSFWRDYSSDPARTTFTAGEWNHLAVTWDGAQNTATFFVNGVNAGSYIRLGTSGPINTTPTILRIGRTDPHLPNDGEWLSSWDGQIDEVRIYNRALSEQEVQALVPEPSTAAFLAMASGALLLRRRNSRNL